MELNLKIKAARAILGWSQDKLAIEAGLSAAALVGIEAGTASPRNRNRKKIIQAFERSGIVFTDNGVEKKVSPIIEISASSGQDCYLEVLGDVKRCLSGLDKPELLISFADDRVSPPAVVEAYRDLRTCGIAMRQMVEEGNDYLMGPLSEYRLIPSVFFINRVTVIYADRVATIHSDESQASIMVDAMRADIQRGSFNLLWELLEEPTQSTADETFE